MLIIQSILIAAPILYLLLGVLKLCTAEWDIRGRPSTLDYMRVYAWVIFMLPASFISQVIMAKGGITIIGEDDHGLR